MSKASIDPLGPPFAFKAETEKLATYFAERRGRAGWVAFDRLMSRSGGEPPRAGDEMPEKERS